MDSRQKLTERTHIGVMEDFLRDKPEKEALFRELRESGRRSHLNKATSSLKRLTSAGNFELAWSVYTSAPDADATLHNAALQLCARALWFRRAISIWEAMPRNAVSYCSMIDVCARCQKLAFAEDVFREMDGARVPRDIAIYNSMIKACAMCGEQERAAEYFRSIPPSVMQQASKENKQVAYQSVMIAAARSSDYSGARELFMEMVSRSVAPNAAHFNALLTACVAPRHKDTARGVFELMAEYRFEPNVVNWTTLMACHRDDLPRCLGMSRDMVACGVEPSSLTNAALLEAYVLAGDGPGARALLEARSGQFYGGRKLEQLKEQARQLP